MMTMFLFYLELIRYYFVQICTYPSSVIFSAAKINVTNGNLVRIAHVIVRVFAITPSRVTRSWECVTVPWVSTERTVKIRVFLPTQQKDRV